MSTVHAQGSAPTRPAHRAAVRRADARARPADDGAVEPAWRGGPPYRSVPRLRLHPAHRWSIPRAVAGVAQRRWVGPGSSPGARRWMDGWEEAHCPRQAHRQDGARPIARVPGAGQGADGRVRVCAVGGAGGVCDRVPVRVVAVV
eukprot:scaffold966_cov79-Isochrysis_galbana.AAC.1